MFKKISIIIRNFFSTATLLELAEVFLFPLLITIIFTIFRNTLNSPSKFLADFNNTAITIVSLLAAFGVASVTLLITANNVNIEISKDSYTKRLDINKKNISYYKLIVIRSFFTLILLLFLIIFFILTKFFTKFNLLLIYIDLYLILVAISSQLLSISSLYFLFSREE